MGNAFTVVVSVESPARPGGEEQPFLEFVPAQCVLTWAWGLQPATALLEWVNPSGAPAIVPLAKMTIRLMDVASGTAVHTFYGIARSAVPQVGTDGKSTFQEFVDSRDFLQWDQVFGIFNQRESKIINGQYVKRYWHIYPADYDAQLKTYTTGPLSAVQILNALFTAPTVESPWTRIYHSALLQPVFNVNCMGGKPLGTVVQEISEELGTTFTLLGGRYTLFWTMKGVGTVPAAPSNSNARRAGSALSANPTRVRLVGDRNLYQVTDIPMVADWVSGWQQLYDLDLLAKDLFENERTEVAMTGIPAGTKYNEISGDTGGLKGYYLAEARARTITVGQYATLRDGRNGTGNLFRDYRKFGGRSRLQMPAALYIGLVLFRAYRPPDNFSLQGVSGTWMDLFSLELVGRSLVEVGHDPATGVMEWGTEVESAGNGYAVAKGYVVGADLYKTLRPEHFVYNEWLSLQDTWQHLSFQIDDSGEGVKFILFDAPVFRTGDLLKLTDTNGATQDYPMLNGVASLTPATVKASLVFAGDPFIYTKGLPGARDAVENVSGLGGEYVCVYGGSLTELSFADGQTASYKADQIASSLLNQQFVYDYGGYEVQGCNGTQLSSMIDRVTLKWNENGTTEEVDYTAERNRNVSVGLSADRKRVFLLHVPSERDFDRRQQLNELLPGQRELREEARQLKLLAVSLHQNPRNARTVVETYLRAFGLDGMPARAHVPAGSGIAAGRKLAAGTPIWRESSGRTSLSPGVSTTPSSPVFQGVTVWDGELADDQLRIVRVTGSGDNGVIYARVKGPVSVNDTVGGVFASVHDYLEGDPEVAVGSALASVGSGSTKLIPVRVTGGGGGGQDCPV